MEKMMSSRLIILFGESLTIISTTLKS